MIPSTEQEQKQSELLPAIAKANPTQSVQRVSSTRVRLQTKIRAKIQSPAIPEQAEENVSILADEMLQEIIEESARVQKRTVLAIALTASVLLCAGGLLSLFQENGQLDVSAQGVKVGVRFTLASAYHANGKHKKVVFAAIKPVRLIKKGVHKL